jgi:hypothetical protein
VTEETSRFVHAALYLLVAGCAYQLKRTRPHHRVLWILNSAFVGATILELLLARARAGMTQPYEGDELVAYYAGHALDLSYPFAVLTACIVYFARGPSWIGPAAYLATFAALVGYKETTGESLIPLHHAVTAIGAAIGWVLLARAVLAPADRLVAPDGVHAVLTLFLAADLVRSLVAYAGPIAEAWAESRFVDIVVHCIVLAGYAVALVRADRRPWPLSQP